MTVDVTIKSNGTVLPDTSPVVSLEVLHEVDRIPSAKIVLLDGGLDATDFKVIDTDQLQAGAEIEILLRELSKPDVSVFKGVVVRATMRLADRRPEIHVELRSKAISMTNHRRSDVFEEKTDSDVIKDIIGNHRLSVGTVAALAETHPALVQYRVTDWDFIVTRAQAMGLCVVVDQDAISVVEPDPAKAASQEVTLWIDELVDMEIEEDALSQVTGVKAQSWDPVAQDLVAPAKGAELALKQGTAKPAEAAEIRGKDPSSLFTSAPATAKEVGLWADGTLARNRLSFLRGRVTIMGGTAPMPMETLKIAGAGDRFSGTGLITAVRHDVNQDGWRTSLTLGLNNRRLVDQPGVQETPAGGLLPAVSGLQVGKVTSLDDDPAGLNRIQIRIPSLGSEAPSLWARMALMHAGPDHGVFFRPELNDEVIVGFANDDPRTPVILGSLYSQDVPETTGVVDAENLTKGIVTRTGVQIIINDADKPSVTISTPAGASFTLDDDAQSATLVDESGNQVVLDADGIQVKSASDMVIDAGGDLTISASGAISIEAGSDVAIKGTAVEMG